MLSSRLIGKWERGKGWHLYVPSSIDKLTSSYLWKLKLKGKKDGTISDTEIRRHVCMPSPIPGLFVAG